VSWLEEPRRDLAAETILDAAAELFRSAGVAATGMAEVAAAAGCSRATLYRYFENRHALRSAFVHREARRIGALVAERTAEIADPEARVVEAVVAALRAVRADPTLAAWFSQRDAGIATELAHASDVIAALSASFRAGLGGGPQGDDPAARWLVRVILSFLTTPGEDEADERALLARFVAPALTGTHPTSRS
jgi:AcrR family transcriptional regulator